MDATLLCNLKGGSRDVALRLRLLHMWLAKPPFGADVYYHCCLWVDQTGMLIQALADPPMASDIEQQLSVGTIYVIKGFGLNIARHLYRACSFDLAMNITRSTTFQVCTLPGADFPTDSFEICPYSSLPGRTGDHRILTDVVGRLHSVGGIDYQLTNNGSTPKQILVLENDKAQRVSITLWNNLAGVLDRTTLIQADEIEPVIIAVGSLMVGRFIGGVYTCSSSSGTRISVNPRIPEAYNLASIFGGPRSPVAELEVKFLTPEAVVADARGRTRTIAELLELHHSGASVDAKHYCGGIVMSIESRSPWYYTSYNMCKRSCSPWKGTSFWCPEHWEVSENQVTIGYKMQLTLRDATGEAPFIVFGNCGNNLVFTTAPLLAQRYPHRPGQLPPELSALYGQFVKFEVKLPTVGSNGVSTGEFRVFRVITQQYHEIQSAVPHGLQPDVPHGIQGSVNRRHDTLPAQNENSQTRPLSSPATLKSSSEQCSEASPSSFSSSKGKEKISGSLFENSNPTFQIGQSVGMNFSQSHTSVPINKNLNNHGNKAIFEVLSKEPITVSSNADLQPQPSTDSVPSADGKLAATKPGSQLQQVCVGSIDPLGIPATPLESLQKKVPGLNSEHLSYTPSGSMIGNSETPQSKIVALTSSTPPYFSPSTTLLTSPLAKVKIEKLDASQPKESDEGAKVTTPFSIGNPESTLRSSTRSTVKRRLYET